MTASPESIVSGVDLASWACKAVSVDSTAISTTASARSVPWYGMILPVVRNARRSCTLISTRCRRQFIAGAVAIGLTSMHASRKSLAQVAAVTVNGSSVLIADGSCFGCAHCWVQLRYCSSRPSTFPPAVLARATEIDFLVRLESERISRRKLVAPLSLAAVRPVRSAIEKPMPLTEALGADIAEVHIAPRPGRHGNRGLVERTGAPR